MQAADGEGQSDDALGRLDGARRGTTEDRDRERLRANPRRLGKGRVAARGRQRRRVIHRRDGDDASQGIGVERGGTARQGVVVAVIDLDAVTTRGTERRRVFRRAAVTQGAEHIAQVGLGGTGIEVNHQRLAANAVVGGVDGTDRDPTGAIMPLHVAATELDRIGGRRDTAGQVQYVTARVGRQTQCDTTAAEAGADKIDIADAATGEQRHRRDTRPRGHVLLHRRIRDRRRQCRGIIQLDHAHRRDARHRGRIRTAVEYAAAVLDLRQRKHPVAGRRRVDIRVLIRDRIDQAIYVRRRHTGTGQHDRRRTAAHGDRISHRVGGGRPTAISTQRNRRAIHHQRLIDAVQQSAHREGQTSDVLSSLDRPRRGTAEDRHRRPLRANPRPLGKGRVEARRRQRRRVVDLHHIDRRGNPQHGRVHPTVAGPAAVRHLRQRKQPPAGRRIVTVGILVGDPVHQGIDRRRGNAAGLRQHHRRRAAGQGHRITHTIGGRRAGTVRTQRDRLAIHHDRFTGTVLQTADRERQTGDGLTTLNRPGAGTREDRHRRRLRVQPGRLGKGRIRPRRRQRRRVIHRRDGNGTAQGIGVERTRTTGQRVVVAVIDLNAVAARATDRRRVIRGATVAQGVEHIAQVTRTRAGIEVDHQRLTANAVIGGVNGTNDGPAQTIAGVLHRRAVHSHRVGRQAGTCRQVQHVARTIGRQAHRDTAAAKARVDKVHIADRATGEQRDRRDARPKPHVFHHRRTRHCRRQRRGIVQLDHAHG